MSRVTVVVNDRPGGSETFLASFARALVDIGHDVTLLALRPSGRAHADLGRRVRLADGLPPMRSWSGPRAAVELGRRHPRAVYSAVARGRRSSTRGGRSIRAAALAAPILATEPDVVHFSFSGIAVSFEPTFDLLTGCRLVTSCRGSAELVQPLIDPERRAALGRVLPRLDAVHVVSVAMAAAVVDLGANLERIGVVRPAVDLDLFPYGAGPPRDDGALRLVAVGRLTPLKGHDDLLAALARLRRGGLDVRLTIVGGGPHRDALLARAHLLGVADHVDLRGPQPPGGVIDALRAADLFVTASLSEGISNAVLEAMAIGIPVVVTDVGGTHEVVTDGRDGVVVPAGDPCRLAEAVASLAHDPAGRAELARAGRARVEASFSLPHQRAEWGAFYADLVSAR